MTTTARVLNPSAVPFHVVVWAGRPYDRAAGYTELAVWALTQAEAWDTARAAGFAPVNGTTSYHIAGDKMTRFYPIERQVRGLGRCRFCGASFGITQAAIQEVQAAYPDEPTSDDDAANIVEACPVCAGTRASCVDGTPVREHGGHWTCPAHPRAMLMARRADGSGDAFVYDCPSAGDPADGE